MVDRTSRVRKSAAALEWLTTRQAGVLLGVHGRTVVRLIQDGKLPARRTMGGQFRLDRTDVERFGTSQQYIPDTNSYTPQHGKEEHRTAPTP